MRLGKNSGCRLPFSYGHMIPFWCVYIVCCGDSTLYTGITNDLEKRIRDHNKGKSGARYTKARRPVRLVYWERSSSRSCASKREYEIKKMRRPEKQKLIKGFQAGAVKPEPGNDAS